MGSLSSLIYLRYWLWDAGRTSILLFFFSLITTHIYKGMNQAFHHLFISTKQLVSLGAKEKLYPISNERRKNREHSNTNNQSHWNAGAGWACRHSDPPWHVLVQGSGWERALAEAYPSLQEDPQGSQRDDHLWSRPSGWKMVIIKEGTIALSMVPGHIPPFLFFFFFFFMLHNAHYHAFVWTSRITGGQYSWHQADMCSFRSSTTWSGELTSTKTWSRLGPSPLSQSRRAISGSAPRTGKWSFSNLADTSLKLLTSMLYWQPLLLLGCWLAWLTHLHCIPITSGL